MTAELDPRWEWIRVQRFGMADRYVRGPCNHLETEPVISVTGAHVAQLCLTCDAQLPPFDLVDQYFDPRLMGRRP